MACCLPCLPCLAPCFGAAWCGWKTSKLVEPSKPKEPVESAIATELRLKIGLHKAKTSKFSSTQEPTASSSAKGLSSKEAKEAAAQERLQRLLDRKHTATSASSKGRPSKK